MNLTPLLDILSTGLWYLAEALRWLLLISGACVFFGIIWLGGRDALRTLDAEDRARKNWMS